MATTGGNATAPLALGSHGLERVLLGAAAPKRLSNSRALAYHFHILVKYQC
ncbi:hypothetical protein ACVIHH_000101 [Bradyrhizobium sp. USDA 4518]|nr:hypothetical protein [Bradyrhizobium sp. USDA 4545]MCP1920044.1 hypothetical protein [Bradyrhizobium sp. USDA 4532]